MFFGPGRAGLEDKMYGPDRTFYEVSIIFGPSQGFFFTIIFGPGRAGPEDKIDGPNLAENLRPLQVYNMYIANRHTAITGGSRKARGTSMVVKRDLDPILAKLYS